MSSLREPLKRSDPAGGFGYMVNRILEHGESVRVGPIQGVNHTTRGTIIRKRRAVASGRNPEDYMFGVDVSGNQVVVQRGLILIQGLVGGEIPMGKDDGLGNIILPFDAFTATGEYCFPTIVIPINAVATAYLTQFASLVGLLDNTNIYVPLVRLKCTSFPTDESAYDFDGAGYIIHEGMIELSQALVFS